STTQLVINFYDSYTNIPSKPSAYTAPAGATTTATQGLLLATKTALLNTTTVLQWTVNYYDKKGRLIQTYKQHYLSANTSSNNYDQVTTTYSFTNKPLLVVRKHYKNVSGPQLQLTLTDSLIYDNMDRLTESWNKINTNSYVQLSNLT